MSIPTNITKDNVLQAIKKIDAEGIPNNGDSKFYDLLYRENHYPPKLVLSYANLFANGVELDRNTFDAGKKKLSFKVLGKLGFTIIEKEKQKEGFPDLKLFFKQVEENNQKYRHFPKIYKDLRVALKIGGGAQSDVPWIAFLGEGQEVKKGIYPGILFYRKHDLLFVNYCVSETNPPPINWDLQNVETVEQYFLSNKLGKPEKYGNSYVYKVYNTNEKLDFNSIKANIDNIIPEYKQLLKKSYNTISVVQPKQVNKEALANSTFDPKSFIIAAKSANLKLDDKLGIRLITSLLTKPFVILTGLSGSGKTKLALAFAQWMSEGVIGNRSSDQYCLVPVGADWTNREPLLGFPNALNPDEYVYPDNGVLELIVKANQHPEKPYFLILDEMNLSHVERYFADFLSAMESKCSIALHDGEQNDQKPPRSIFVPNNLFIIGTVNIDETTYMFSPKVLDRASVIEFRVTYEEMKSYLNGYKALNLKSLNYMGAEMGSDFISIACSQIEGNGDFMTNSLLKFFDVLKKGGAEFGYRSASEILRYAYIVKKLGVNWSDDEIFDTAIMQKLLPKVHGSRRKLEAHLKSMAELCLNKTGLFDQMVKQFETDRTIDYTQVKYPLSFEKIMRMYRNLLSNGFTSYAEA